MYEFKPPAYLENPMGYGMLLRYFLTPQGYGVAKVDGDFFEVLDPTTEEIESWDSYYPGGYIHIVSDPEGLALQAAGYEVTAL